MNKQSVQFLIIFLIPLLIFSSCKKDDSSDLIENEFFSIDYYYSGISTLEIEVAYEVSAVPYIENSSLFGTSKIWNLTKNNIEALFKTRTVETQVIVPFELSEMQVIPKQKQGDYTSNDIKEIASKYRLGNNDTPNKGNIFVMFVDAYFSQNGQRQEQVLGVTIGNTPYVTIFKPVINSLQAGEGTKKNVEQATIIHEIGHALGLVDFGIPMASDHKDEEHGSHCNNQDCIMYWEVANFAAAGSFASLIQDNQAVLFGPECLADTRSYQP